MQDKKSILIIEDNLDIVELYTVYFEQAGFEVHTSVNGLLWLVEIVNLNPSIILLDIMMPQMNWFEVLESIVKLSDIHIPVVVASNLWEGPDKDMALNLWADMFITKADHEVPEIVELAISVLN